MTYPARVKKELTFANGGKQEVPRWIEEQLWRGLIDGGTDGIRKASINIFVTLSNNTECTQCGEDGCGCCGHGGKGKHACG